MEATENKGAGILHQILPPRLEDAGLEDCALPPDSIKEAFLKAATAVKSRATSIFTSDEDEESFEDCVNDPWPDLKYRTGELVGAEPETRSAGSCSGNKGGSVEVGGDEVVVGGEEEKGDKAIVGGEDVRGGGERDCVDGLAGLEIGEKKKGEEEEAKDGGGPILFIISDRISKSFKNGQVFRVLPSSNVFQFPALCSLFLGPACLSALVGQRPSIIVFLLATTIFALAMWGWDSKYGSQRVHGV